MDVIDGHLASAPAINDEKYLTAYFGRQSDYYLSEYKACHNGVKFSFNIGSFFGGLFWFMYRKLFLQLLIIVGIITAIGFFQAIVSELFSLSETVEKAFEMIVKIFTWLGLGFIGNYLYIKQSEKNIRTILSSTDDEEERLMRLQRKGGVSNSPYFVLIILLIAIIIFGALV
jgi:hypothetical protein